MDSPQKLPKLPGPPINSHTECLIEIIHTYDTEKYSTHAMNKLFGAYNEIVRLVFQNKLYEQQYK